MSKSIMLDPGIRGFVPVGTRKAANNREEAGLADAQNMALENVRREAQAEARAGAKRELDAERKMQAEKCGICGRQFDAFLDNMKKEIADQVIRLSVKLSEMIIRHELPDREMIFNVMKETLEPISDLQGAKVRMNPAEAEMLRNRRGDSSVPMVISDRVEIVGDPGLSLGDLVIESRNGVFDARLSQRLTLLEERLKARQNNNHANEG